MKTICPARSTVQPQRRAGTRSTGKGRARGGRRHDGNESECRSANWSRQEIPPPLLLLLLLAFSCSRRRQRPLSREFSLLDSRHDEFPRSRVPIRLKNISRFGSNSLLYLPFFFFLSFFLSFNDVETIANGRATSHLWIIGRTPAKGGRFISREY